MRIIVIVEVHKLLQSCQVLVICNEELLLDKIRLSITCDTICLMDSVGGVLCKASFTEIKLKPNLISGLLIDGNKITFRVQIEQETSLRLLENRGIKYKPDIAKNQDIHIYCACCCNVICKTVHFKRVLPLPSVEDLNYDDFFCHKHNHDKDGFDDNDSMKNKLQLVAENDFLFDENYSFKINKDYVSNCKLLSIIHCHNCLSWIGKKTENHVKLWNSSVRFNVENVVENVALNDFKNAVLCKLNNSISPIYKIVITCCIADKSTHYILLRILNKNLTILTNCQQKDSEHEKDDNVTTLNETKVMKVSYSYTKEKDEIVQTWLNEPLIETIEVSKQMLLAGCNSLIKSTLMIPEHYRCIDNMNVGYLGLM